MRVRVAVPSGVGDVYWVLTKLEALRKARGWSHVTLCVQKTHLPRALEWASMVDFVDAAEEYPFRPDAHALQHGYSWSKARTARGGDETAAPDCTLWPNAIVDQGRRLSEWLPEIEIDLSFPVRTLPATPGRVVVYASSEAVNRSWLARLGPNYWTRFLGEIAAATNVVPTLIGADWDVEFRARLGVEVEDLVGDTTLRQVAGILESASVVVGVISGMTIVANHFRTPTVALSPDKFPQSFPRSWVAEEAPYVPIRASDVPPARDLALIAAGLREVVPAKAAGL